MSKVIDDAKQKLADKQKFFNLYEKLHGSEWAKRYKKWLTDTLVFDEKVIAEEGEGFRDEFIGVEVDRLVTLITETGEIGEYAIECLEKWSVDEMRNTYGVIWLLEVIVARCWKKGMDCGILDTDKKLVLKEE